jgi:lysozyme family protein
MFNQAVNVILKHEGGLVNNPNDPGGITNFGISKRSYPEVDIYNLTKEQAKDIYLNDYWKPLQLYRIDNANICLELFDFAVNAGPSRAVKMAQKLVGTKEDGQLGGITANAINEFEGDFVKVFKHARIIYYEALVKNKPSLKIFLKGWLRRVDSNYFINI